MTVYLHQLGISRYTMSAAPLVIIGVHACINTVDKTLTVLAHTYTSVSMQTGRALLQAQSIELDPP